MKRYTALQKHCLQLLIEKMFIRFIIQKKVLLQNKSLNINISKEKNKNLAVKYIVCKKVYKEGGPL
ncbi:hypothetical protein SAMN05421544_103111 [Riemerella columbipharyngis]|uniref:Uncharacterized protein n=1 Tax=Riemerella columbipharyngis TaxID=1071918 RepID=A0A1G7AB31_9FLAO|nr:hypothetical protein SAMN05421544_103111 [Riemerella columbipharyngis]